jgi:hypothetical protein
MRPGADQRPEREAQRAREVERSHGAAARPRIGELGDHGERRRKHHRGDRPQQEHQPGKRRPRCEAHRAQRGAVEQRPDDERPHRAIALDQPPGHRLQQCEGQQEEAEQAPAQRRVVGAQTAEVERKGDQEEADREPVGEVEQARHEQPRPTAERRQDVAHSGPGARRQRLGQRQRADAESEEQPAGEPQRRRRSGRVADGAADRRAQPDAEDQRAADDSHRAPAARVVGVVGDQRHQRRPPHHREGALHETQREQRSDRLHCRIEQVQETAAEKADHDPRLASAAAIAEHAPERREQDVRGHLDGEKQRRIGDRAAEMVDHPLLEPGDRQREVEHRHQQQGRRQPQRAPAAVPEHGGRRGVEMAHRPGHPMPLPWVIAREDRNRNAAQATRSHTSLE